MVHPGEGVTRTSGGMKFAVRIVGHKICPLGVISNRKQQLKGTLHTIFDTPRRSLTIERVLK